MGHESKNVSMCKCHFRNQQLKAFYVDLLVPLETNLEKDTKVVQVSDTSTIY